MNKMQTRQQPYIRQTIQLTGFNCDKFGDGIDTLQRLHQILSRQVPEGAMEPFAINQLGRFPMVELATRYFTSRRDDPTGV
jgi:hypothetical protein